MKFLCASHFVWACCAVSQLEANPELAKAVAGDVSLAEGASFLNVSASDRAIIEWNRFSIAEGETVCFLQPSTAAIVLNRVVGSEGTEIFGSLHANGIVYLINSRGILIGKNGTIDTAGFFASTLDVNNDSFLKGEALHLQGDSEGAIVCLGTIRACEGDIFLMAHQVTQEGTLSALKGTVALSASHDLLIKPKSCPLLNIRPNLPALGITQSGQIEALSAYLQSDSFSIVALRTQGEIHLSEEGGKIKLFSSGGPIHIEDKADLKAPAGEISVHLASQEDAKPLYLLGSLDASGSSGGRIEIEAPKVLHCAALKAEGEIGGHIRLEIEDALIETAAAHNLVRGKTAGSISCKAAHLFSSGTYEAKGEKGGSIHLLGQEITLAAAHLNADGEMSGGQICVGGGFQGKDPALCNAEKVFLNPATVLTANGGEQGGMIVVWAGKTNENYASLSVNGPLGGQIEVSAKEELLQRGSVHAVGLGGEVLFDPQNITIDEVNGVYAQYQLIDPNAGSGSGFGTAVEVLSTGNIVVTKPNDNFAAAAAGAVYLYSGETGALISTITGSTASDQVGITGITVLTGNGNYVFRSSNWDNGLATNAGAATWGNGTTGVSGTVSTANSLIGSTASDQAGSTGITALTNGNYVVRSSSWDRVDGGALTDAGAATWGNGTTGITGTVSVVNSLIGSTGSDQVGSGATALTNGNYVVTSPNWDRVDGGVLGDVGAATWGNGTTGITGTVSIVNSLIGSTGSDQVGSSGATALTNGNYVVASLGWDRLDGGALLNVGAATWGNGTSGITGTVSVVNSLIGSTASDQVGLVTALTNDNYVVRSPNWDRIDGGLLSGVGAATWGDGTTGITGTVSVVNSLIGSSTGDAIGSGSIIALTNGNYVVPCSSWNRVDGGVLSDVGAVAWGNGTTGISGTVSIVNSLIGSTLNDRVGSGGATALTNGNYVVRSPNWDRVDGGGATDVGAATWGNGTTGITGTVSIVNSLIGSTGSDGVGGNAIALTNGNYVVISLNWDRVDGGGLLNVGAVTWGNGTTGITGTVSIVNSLIGSTQTDQVGSGGVTALTNGNYVAQSPLWNRVTGGALTDAGAATWGNGTTGTTGTVSIVNSLIGSTTSDFASGTVVALSNDHYLVSLPNWDRIDGGSLTNCGAVTYASSASGITGTVSQKNSVIGGIANSGLGTPLDNTSVEETFVCPFPTEGAVRIGLTSPNQLVYALAPDQNLTILPSFVTDTLNAGTNVSLFANDDITISSLLSYNTGNLSLSAGRSVLFNANVSTGGANLTVVANDTLADGVIDADRSAGTAVITIANTVTLDGGGGNISLSLLDGAGKTNSDSGDISFGTNSQLITSGSGTLTVFAQENNISFGNGALLQAENGSALFQAGVSLLAVGTTPTFQMTGTGVLTLVADNLNPTAPSIGSGKIDMNLAVFSATNPIRFYTTSPSDNTFPATINGTAYVPGVTLSREVYSTYYPAGTATGAFTVFYKGNAPPTPTASGGFSNSQIAQARLDYDRSISEAFWLWNYRFFGPYLSDDIWPPLWTPKGLNFWPPSLFGQWPFPFWTYRNFPSDSSDDISPLLRPPKQLGSQFLSLSTREVFWFSVYRSFSSAFSEDLETPLWPSKELNFLFFPRAIGEALWFWTFQFLSPYFLDNNTQPPSLPDPEEDL